ncbi:MAG: HD domain-containing protein [Kiritimatiellaeota bacterium]|nr:HD domain-containing protein [Kiritimatiellota bacterium]
MTCSFLKRTMDRYQAYADTFRDERGVLPTVLRLKLDHTHHVVEESRRIAEGEGWGKNACLMGEVCALLHDTARYLQFHAFGTFRDSDSFDHAERSAEIVQQKRWLDALPEGEQCAILTAVRLHNKREVGPGLAGLEAALVHLVRDADKLDIFRVLDEAVTHGTLMRHPEIAWGLKMTGGPNPEVVEAVSKGQTVDYGAVRTFTDFVLIQVGWLNGGLRFKTAMRLAAERDVVGAREKLLKKLAPAAGHEAIERCCAAAREFLAGQIA